MAKGSKKRKHSKKGHRKAAKVARGKPVAHPKFAGRDYECVGKQVRKKGGGRRPAVFCHKKAA